MLNHQTLDGHPAKHLTISDMAAYYVQGILKIDPHGPYYLGGYSIGGMILYEVACQLCAQGKKVPALFMLDPTELNEGTHSTDMPMYQRVFCRERQELRHLGYVIYFKRLMQRIKAALMVQTHFSLGKPIPAAYFWQSIEPVYLQAIKAYVPTAGKYRQVVIVQSANGAIQGWLKRFQGKAEIHRIDCGHLDLREPPYLQEWINLLGTLLASTEMV